MSEKSVREGIKLKISASLLEQVAAFFDRLTGTVEPVHRKFLLYAENGLFFQATDGCLVATLKLPPYKPDLKGRAYVFPLDLFRQFVREKKETAEITLGRNMEIHLGRDTLFIEGRITKRPQKLKRFFSFAKIEKRPFLEVLDFSSIHLSQGDVVDLKTMDGFLFCLAETNHHLAGARTLFAAESAFSLRVSYESIRHLIKALELVRYKSFSIGRADRLIAIKAGSLLLTMCGDESGDKIDKAYRFLFKEPSPPLWEIEALELKACISRAARIQKISGCRAKLTLNPDRLKISLEAQGSVYTTEAEFLSTKNPVSISFNIRADRINSLLSRISDKRITFFLSEYALIIRASHRAIAISQT